MHMLIETEELLICMQCCESFSLIKGRLTVFPERQQAGWESWRSGTNQAHAHSHAGSSPFQQWRRCEVIQTLQASTSFINKIH